VLAFGGIWGFWGVFFAIPLATLVQAILGALPQRTNGPPDSPSADTASPAPSAHEAQPDNEMG
jgi:putative permease